MKRTVNTRSMKYSDKPGSDQGGSSQLPAPASNRLRIEDAAWVDLDNGMRGRYGRCPIATLKPDPNSVRNHPQRQIKKLALAIKATTALSPVIVDETWTILAGHARVKACQSLGWIEVPIIQVSGASEAQKKIFSIADNRVAEDAAWDREKLARLMPDISKLLEEANYSISTLGFDASQLDELVADFGRDLNAEEQIPSGILKAPPVLIEGDHLRLGSHALMVADARSATALDTLCDGTAVAAVLIDPPYNLRVRDIGGRGRVKHEEFAFASGEMSRDEFKAFLTAALTNAARVSRQNALHYVFIDRKHVGELLEVGEAVYDAYLDLIVWNKTNAGQGGLYRSQHELIGLFRVGPEQHVDNVQMGRTGRNRSNVWTYPGSNTFRPGRMEDLTAHPTVKPLQMIAEAVKDCTQLGDVVLDTFVGSGTTLLASEKVGRRALVMDCNPQYADIAVRRWQAMTGRDAVHLETGLTFDQLSEARAREGRS